MKSFGDIASKYDNLWFFSEAYQSWMVERIIKNLNLADDDNLCDLGGGTGRIIDNILEMIPLTKEPVCVEPSKEMLAEARKMPHVICVEDTAENYVRENLGLEKILIKEAIHHFQDRRLFWRNLASNSPGCQVLVVTRPQRPGFPLFEKAYEKFADGQPSIEVLIEEAENSGFKVSAIEESWDISMPSDQWFELLRNRFISDLFSFSDREIDQGIDSMRQSVIGDKVSFKDKIIFLRASIYD